MGAQRDLRRATTRRRTSVCRPWPRTWRSGSASTGSSTTTRPACEPTARPRCSARDRQAVRPRARAARGRFHAGSRRSACAARRERRGQDDPDAGGVRPLSPGRREVAVHGIVRAVTSPRRRAGSASGWCTSTSPSMPAFTVAENVALAAGWPVAPGALRERVRASAERVGLPLDPDARAGELCVALKQRLEIVKALAADAAHSAARRADRGAGARPKPTSCCGWCARSPGGRRRGADHAQARRGAGVGGPGHRAAAGRRGLFRAGRGQRHASLAAAMIGEGDRRVSTLPPRFAQPGREPPVLVRAGGARGPARFGLRHRAFGGARSSVRAGEIVGIAAVEGNGQRELLRAVAGRLRPLRGRREVAARWRSFRRTGRPKA